MRPALPQWTRLGKHAPRRKDAAMSRRSQTAVVLGLLLALVVAESAPSRQDKPAVGKGKKTGQPPLVMVAVGDSITAGFADATLMEKAQRVSYPALIARQMGIAFGQPYITGDGLPWLGFRFHRKERVLEIPVLPPLLGGPGRKNPSNEDVHNFAVPNAKTWEILSLSKKPGNDVDRLFQVILQGKGTQIEQARAQQPDLILVWVGNNDVLGIVAGAPDDGDGKHSYRLES